MVKGVLGGGAVLLTAPSPLELAGGAPNSALRRESQGSLNSSASLDLGFLAFVSSKSEVSGLLEETTCGLGPLLMPLCVATIIPSHGSHLHLPAASTLVSSFSSCPHHNGPHAWHGCTFLLCLCVHTCGHPGVDSSSVVVSGRTCLWVRLRLGEHTYVPIGGVTLPA